MKNKIKKEGSKQKRTWGRKGRKKKESKAIFGLLFQ